MTHAQPMLASRPIRIYYHVYADGDWHPPASEFLLALHESQLSGEAGILYLGLVGSAQKRDAARAWFEERTSIKVVAEANEGWEQVTLQALHEDALADPNFYVLYAHTKGAANPSAINTSWRRQMTGQVVGSWQRAVSYLSKYDAVGIYWIPRLSFFAGNFWWANSQFISTLAPPGLESRHAAESWFRDSAPNGLTIHDMRPGFPSRELPRINLMRNKEIVGMIVTFRADSKIAEYRPGRIYEDVLTPWLEVQLRNGAHLVLIDPPTLDPQPAPTPAPTPAPAPEPPKKEAKYVSKKSPDLANKPGPDTGSDHGNGTEKESGERPADSEGSGSDI